MWGNTAGSNEPNSNSSALNSLAANNHINAGSSSDPNAVSVAASSYWAATANEANTSAAAVVAAAAAAGELELLHHAEQQLAAHHRQQQLVAIEEERQRQLVVAYEREVVAAAMAGNNLFHTGYLDGTGVGGMQRYAAMQSEEEEVEEEDEPMVEILEERRHAPVSARKSSVASSNTTNHSFLKASPVQKRNINKTISTTSGRNQVRSKEVTTEQSEDTAGDISFNTAVEEKKGRRKNADDKMKESNPEDCATPSETTATTVATETTTQSVQPKIRGKVLKKPPSPPPTTPTRSKTKSVSSSSSSKTKKRKSSSTDNGSKSSSPSKKKRTSSNNTPSTSNSSKTGTPRSRKTASSSRRKTPSSSISSTTSSQFSSVLELLSTHTGSLPPLQCTKLPPITTNQYSALDSLMTAFCRVPFLAEFSRPISLLHPELAPIYSKVVQLPIDLGRVCRAIRRREYNNLRAVCVDVWRIFANCVKYHSHPSTRDGAIVSFISIAMHLREFFNALWLEHMVPSDSCVSSVSSSSSETAEDELITLSLQNGIKKRDVIRKERVNALQQTGLSLKCLQTAVNSLDEFIRTKGRVDALDTESILSSLSMNDNDDSSVDENDLASADAVFSALSRLSEKIRKLLGAGEDNDDDEEREAALDFTVDSFDNEVRRCYEDETILLPHLIPSPPLRNIFRRRLNRLLGKIFALVLEVNGRGGNQSSIWGCMAAVIWARQSTKKPYWPALVLGIMAPDDQREEWHRVVTHRNEARLPEKLRIELQTGKRKAELAIRRQNNGTAERMSFFLVEFLGTHEFIWIREADIIERFDPNVDPNSPQGSGNPGNITKKKKTNLRGQTAATERMRQKAIDEGKWAMQEFDMQLGDPCGDISDEEEEEEEENYSFAVLCESDDEADQVEGGLIEDTNFLNNPDGSTSETIGNSSSPVTPSSKMSLDNLDEVYELLATDGLLDYSMEGRKNAKRRAAALKKQQVDAKREAVKKEKEQKTRKAKAAKKAKDEEINRKRGQTGKSKKSKEVDKQKRLTDLENRREQKELEKRRKKRERDRERFLKEEERKAKKMKSGDGIKSVVKRGRKLGIVDKRGRAATIIRGYLNRVAAKDDLKGLGLSGVWGVPSASVEASGLLGMTLAFRAAAGEIEMPNTNDNPSIFKPWEKIDTAVPLSSTERCENLKKQVKLLEDALAKLEKDNLRREEQVKEAVSQKEKNDAILVKAEKEARKNDMPKRKPCIRKKDNTSKKSNADDQSNEIDKEDTENKVKEEDLPDNDNDTKINELSDAKQISENQSLGDEVSCIKEPERLGDETISCQSG